MRKVIFQVMPLLMQTHVVIFLAIASLVLVQTIRILVYVRESHLVIIPGSGGAVSAVVWLTCVLRDHRRNTSYLAAVAVRTCYSNQKKWRRNTMINTKRIVGFGVLFFALLITLPVICRGDEDVSALHIDFSNPIFSRLDEEGKNVLREYAKVYPKIKKFYGNIRMDVTEKDYRLTADKALSKYIPLKTPPILEREESFEVRYNTRDGDTRDGGFARVDSQIQSLFVGEGSTSGREDQIRYPRHVNLITPEAGYAFSKKNSKNSSYSLTAKREHDKFMRTKGVKVLEFDSAPFSAGPMELENLFFRPPFFAKDNYFVTAARYIEDDQKVQMVELVACIDDPPQSNIWVVRLMRENWVVKDVFCQGWTVEDKYWQRFQCEYDGTFEDMPLLSNYQQNYGVYDTDKAQLERLVQQIRYDVTKIIPGPVDVSEFDVAQFLPPRTKVGDVTPASNISFVRIACIVVGIILMIFGLYMKIKESIKPSK